jgi:hypothetical protein
MPPATPRPPPFWSFDSKSLAFDAGGKLKKIDVSGNPPKTVCDIRGLAMGGAWNKDDVIIFADYPGGLMRVSANGGSAAPVTTLDASRRETYHGFPSLLESRRVIYLRHSDAPGKSGICVASLDARPEDQDPKQILTTTFAATYVPSSDTGMGQLLFVRGGTLIAQSFDAAQLELKGELVPLVEQVGFFLDRGFFSTSTNGILVYGTGSSGTASQLTWFDREGRVLGSVGEPGTYLTLALSPGGERAAVSRFDYSSSSPTLWLLDLLRGTMTRFTVGSSSTTLGTWSSDGSRIFFASNPGGTYDLYQKLASGLKDEELLLESSEDKRPTSCSPDGRFLLYRTSDPKTKKKKRDLWVLPLQGDRKPFPFVRTEFNNVEGQFSPNGSLVAYVSDESGRPEIYVRTFSLERATSSPQAGGKWLISTGGGSQPRWRGDGNELYYLAPDGKLMAVEIEPEPVFRAGMPKALFQTPPQVALSVAAHSWNLTPDGKRFLFISYGARHGVHRRAELALPSEEMTPGTKLARIKSLQIFLVISERAKEALCEGFLHLCWLR